MRICGDHGCPYPALWAGGCYYHAKRKEPVEPGGRRQRPTILFLLSDEALGLHALLRRLDADR